MAFRARRAEVDFVVAGLIVQLLVDDDLVCRVSLDPHAVQDQALRQVPYHQDVLCYHTQRHKDVFGQELKTLDASGVERQLGLELAGREGVQVYEGDLFGVGFALGCRDESAVGRTGQAGQPHVRVCVDSLLPLLRVLEYDFVVERVDKDALLHVPEQVAVGSPEPIEPIHEARVDGSTVVDCTCHLLYFGCVVCLALD